MKMLHAEITPEYWRKFSLLEQLANVGMEIERTIKWKIIGQPEDSKNAFYRALKLMDLTDPKNSGPRRRELARVKEALVDYFVYENIYGSSDALWQGYFFAYSYAAALQRGR